MKTTKKKPQNEVFSNGLKNAIPKHCSNCGYKYTENDLTLIKKDDFGAVFHLTCGSCKEAYLINVVSPLGMLQGSNRIPLRVDISSPKEAKKFIGKDFVSSNDILDAYDLLKQTSSGKIFISLLSKKD